MASAGMNGAGFTDASLDQLLELRRALGHFATGVTVVTARDGPRPVGLTVNSFVSVSLDPPLVLWGLRLASPLYGVFRRCSTFAVNILSSRQVELSRRFATPEIDRFEGLSTFEGLDGVPLLPGCVASFECRREQGHVAGDHAIFIGRVERFTASERGHPLVLCRGRYIVEAALPNCA